MAKAGCTNTLDDDLDNSRRDNITFSAFMQNAEGTEVTMIEESQELGAR